MKNFEKQERRELMEYYHTENRRLSDQVSELQETVQDNIEGFRADVLKAQAMERDFIEYLTTLLKQTVEKLVELGQEELEPVQLILDGKQHAAATQLVEELSINAWYFNDEYHEVWAMLEKIQEAGGGDDVQARERRARGGAVPPPPLGGPPPTCRRCRRGAPSCWAGPGRRPRRPRSRCRRT